MPSVSRRAVITHTELYVHRSGTLLYGIKGKVEVTKKQEENKKLS
jgi:hypothetical protein